MIHLVTDTTAYLPEQLERRWQIQKVPLKINVDYEAVDEDKIAPEVFYRRLARVETAPSTSQPAPGEFMTLYEALTRNGDEVLSVHISEGLSGTPLVAQMAAREVAPDRITVVDSQATTCALALMVEAAAQALANGASRAEAAAVVEGIRARFGSAFLVEDLEYLRKGGRINGAAKFLGAMLNVRPILYLKEGKIEPLGLARTRKRGLRQLVQEVRKQVGEGPVRAAVTHIQCPEEAQALAEQARAQLNCVELFINETGPVIGSHVGPGFIGLAAYPV
ncbi:MAG: DegV family protein [Anaerolineae bacterium]